MVRAGPAPLSFRRRCARRGAKPRGVGSAISGVSEDAVPPAACGGTGEATGSPGYVSGVASSVACNLQPLASLSHGRQSDLERVRQTRLVESRLR
jgi:hypothetical protein